MELLVDELSKFVTEPLTSPLTPECFVVQGRGMALYLMMELSQRSGICANSDFVYPRNFVQRAFDSILNEPESVQGAERSELLWRVLAELPRQRDVPEFARLRDYLADDPTGLRRLQLVRRIADLFDQYVTYRPDMILAWDKGDDSEALRSSEAWQPILWRAVAGAEGRHAAAREQRFHDALARRGASLDKLPERVALFGISSLPPLYVRVIAALARQIDVRLFILSPCQEFWADLASAREVDRRAAQGLDPQALHVDTLHPLLASLGKVGADFQNVLSLELEALGVQVIEHDVYRAPQNASSLLGRVQAEILHLRGPQKNADDKRLMPENDASITLHSCHSAMRQVEVLHDQLLDILTRDHNIQPKDIVVMMPDVEEYAPLVEAVFERDRADSQYIPYKIADRSLSNESPVMEAFFRILRTAGGRAKASEVLDLLRLQAVRAKFHIKDDDLEKLTRWVVESGIRWGSDAAHRERHDQPALEQNTWRFGLNRLLLGYAMPGFGQALFRGVLPFDEIEGQDAELLGNLAEFVDRLFTVHERLEAPRTIDQWQLVLGEVLDTLLECDTHNDWEAQKIRATLSSLVELASRAGFAEAIGLKATIALLEEQLDDAQLARGFLSGGITFCAMVPMRSIPFKVVCLLGLNDAVFPRESRTVEFDLTRKAGSSGRRPGDRSRRDDDRYLFLEALLAARERLIVTFTGQSIKDNSRMPPSVVVSELLEHISAAFAGKNQQMHANGHEPSLAFATGLVVRHPLQPFSPRYFDRRDERLFSYAASYCEGASSLSKALELPGSLFERPLTGRVRDEERQTVSLSELIRFFELPIKYLLNRRLQVYLTEKDFDVPDREPWQLSKLEEWAIGHELVELGVSDLGLESYEIIRASGELPPGVPGQYTHAVLARETAPIAAKVRECRGREQMATLAVNLELLNGVLLSGELTDIYDSGLVVHQYSRLSGKNVLAAWIRHLVLCQVASNADVRSTLIGRPSTSKDKQPFQYYCWGSVRDSRLQLSKLIELFELGHSQPLLLFPRSSFEYARVYRVKSSREAALAAAGRVWESRTETGERIGEGSEPHLYRVFGEEYWPGSAAPFEVAEALGFERLACSVFNPLLDLLVSES